jgi:hypothetical protein
MIILKNHLNAIFIFMTCHFVMRKLTKNSTLSRSFPAVAALSVSVIGIIIVLGFSTTTPLGIAFAQTDNATTTGTTTTAAANATTMMGVIASMQLDENGNPAWITAGHWNLESDAPLVGGGASNETEPHISNFSATLYMVKNEDGRDFHQHEVSNFKQASVTHQGANSTTVNGTFTITLQQGPVDNVNGYIHVINDKIELWVDPVATDNHFGPTTITGMVLNPERFSELMGQQGTTTTTGTVQQ